MIYFDYDRLLEAHREIFEVSTGLDGVRDEGLLRSCLEWIQDDNYYPDFVSKMTHLVFSIAMNHAFVDGNKRTSIVAGTYLLIDNDYPTECIDNFPRYMENIVLQLAEGKLSKEDLQTKIAEYLKSF